MGKAAPWNWERADWPEFHYDSKRMAPLENAFARQSGIFAGAVRHVTKGEKEQLIVELLSDETLHTSEIEGVMLNRASVQSSLRQHFGLAADLRKILPAEQGISQMMAEMHRQFDRPVSSALLYHWHRLLMKGRRDLKEVGCYRTGADPMQVVSGALHDPKVHFEAPPSARIPAEMDRFLKWFQQTGPGGPKPLPLLTRAGIAHLYFVTLHPFEDGNGRIGRALVEKALAEGLGQATLISLSRVIANGKKAYYGALQASNYSNEITAWLAYFGQVILEAQALAQATVDFLIQKTQFHDRLRGQLNERQDKVLSRVFREGPCGFEGGLSAEKYIRLTGASRATATRDLQDLVRKQALTQTGTLKSTRYHLVL